jgi:uncharacterized protein YjbJ (UPF0337 family)
MARKIKRSRTMNWDQVEGRWKEMRGKVKEKWGKLTDDDLDVINGSREQLEGRIQRHYGKTREETRREVDDFCTTCR